LLMKSRELIGWSTTSLLSPLALSSGN